MDNESNSASISASIASPSTESSCQALTAENNPTCNVKLLLTNNFQTPLTLTFTQNKSGAPQPLPAGYLLSGLTECVGDMNNHLAQQISCYVQINYSGDSESQVPAHAYFMLCKGFCDAKGNPLAITKAPILLNTSN